MAYNNSPLTKAEWNSCEKKCLKDEALTKVWETYKLLFNGSNKTAITTYDKVVDFIEDAVDAIIDGTLLDDAIDDLEDELEVGQVINSKALRKGMIAKILRDKDDKTPERLNTLLANYPKYIEERNKLLSSLSVEDEEEFNSSGRLVKVAEQYMKR
jgi:hypothetical protein